MVKSVHDGHTGHFYVNGESIADKEVQQVIINSISNGEFAYIFSPNWDDPPPTYKEVKHKVDINIYEVNQKCDAIGDSLIPKIIAKCEEDYNKLMGKETADRELADRALYEQLKKRFEGK